MRFRSMVVAVLFAALPAAAADVPDNVNPLPVRDVMLLAVIPATDRLWSIGNPQSDSDWIPYERAAATVALAGIALRARSNLPAEAERAADERWQYWSEAMIEAAMEALATARARDLDALVEITNNKLYTPCEECHKAFFPAAP